MNEWICKAAKSREKIIGITKAQTIAQRKRIVEAGILNIEELQIEGLDAITSAEAFFAKLGIGLGETSMAVILATARNVSRNIRILRGNTAGDVQDIDFSIASLTEEERAAGKSKKLFGLFDI